MTTLTTADETVTARSALDALLQALGDFGRAGMRGARRAVNGYDPETGEAVLQTERALTLLGGALPFGVGGRAGGPVALLTGRQADGVERGLSAAQVERLAGLLTDGVSEMAPAAAGAGAGEAGALAYRMPAAGQGRWSAAGHLAPESMRIELAAGLNPAERARVLAHETGHAIDLTGGMSAAFETAPPGVAPGLQTLSRRYRPEVWRDGGGAYAADPAETVADGLALYLTDPAAAKALSAEAAAWLRAVANRDPQIRRHVLFNARPPAGLLETDP